MRTFCGSVTNVRTFARISSGSSRIPIALSKLFDIFRPSEPGISDASDSSACGSTSTSPYRRLKRRTISRDSSRCETWSSPTGTSCPRTIVMSTVCRTG